jgi:acyl-CoA synthetase (NDP forming)
MNSNSGMAAGLSGQAEALLQLFTPRRVAVIGASANAEKFGGKAVANLIRHGFKGEILPVNPNRSEVQGRTAIARLEDVPAQVDVAILAIPARDVLGELRKCADMQVGLAIVLAGGFAETGPEGAAMQAEFRQLSRDSGMRILGPNSLGLANIHERAVVAATGAFDLPDLLPGAVSVVAQSGMLGYLSILNRAYDAGIGLRLLVTTGNEADVDASQVIEAMLLDPLTEIVLAQLEAIRDPERFTGVIEQARALRKPIVVLKTGRTSSGRAAANAHTAALAGSDAVNDAVFRRHGVVRVMDIDELWQAAQVLGMRPRPSGNRLALVTTSGGLSGVFADIAEMNGFCFPRFQPSTVRELVKVLPSEGVVNNPLDVTGNFTGTGREPEIFERTLALVSADPNIDTLVFAPGIPKRSYDHVATALPQLVSRTGKPTVLISVGGSIARSALESLPQAGLPVFWSISDCVTALKHACDYATFDASGIYPSAHRDPHISSIRYVQEDADRKDSARLLGYLCTVERLASVGISLPRAEVVSSPPEAVLAAADIGYPVALKLLASDLVHKSDVGGVALGLASAEDVRHAADTMMASRPGAELLVQRMAHDGLELLVGLVRDPQFGLIGVAGFGGMLAEVLRDVAVMPLPVTEPELNARMAALRGSKLLTGYRGQKPVDLGPIRMCLAKLEALASRYQDIAAIDINPVILPRDGTPPELVDIKIMISESPAQE